MIVIGIDPGLATVGFGVIRTENGNITPISYGCIRTSANKQTPERLLEIFNEITSLLEKIQSRCYLSRKNYFSVRMSLMD